MREEPRGAVPGVAPLSRRALLVGLLLLLGALVGPGVARGATGDLNYQGCITGEVESASAGTGACSAIATSSPEGTGSGFDGPVALDVSADGRSVYVAVATDRAIARFDRDVTTGELSFADCIGVPIQLAACTPIDPATPDGFDLGLRPEAITVSPDDANVYVSGPGVLAWFDRDPETGALTYAGCISASLRLEDVCTLTDSATQVGAESSSGIGGSVAVSDDGSSIYTTKASSIAQFGRDPATGALTYAGCVSGNFNAAPVCRRSSTATVGGRGSGLDELRQIVTSPDGLSVYGVSLLDDAVAGFDRDPATGRLTFAGCISGTPNTAGRCVQLESASIFGHSGLAFPLSLDISPDGNQVYTAALEDDAVATFERDPLTGALEYASCITGQALSICTEIESSSRNEGIDSGLDSLLFLTASGDGESVYTLSRDDNAIAHFARSPAGGLTYRSCITGETAAAVACTAIGSARPGGFDSGLYQPAAAAASADGRNVYVVSWDDDAIATFAREPTEPPVPDTTPPRLTLRGEGKQRGDEVVVRAGCDEICEATIGATTRGRLAAGGKKSTFALAKVTAQLGPDSQEAIVLTFEGAAAATVERLLAKHRKLKLSIDGVAADRAGNESSAGIKVMLER